MINYQREVPQHQDEREDKRTSDQMLLDIAAANKIRGTAEHLEILGDHATATIFRDAAQKMETGMNWLDDADVREVQR
jgi:hypothetical protein